MKICKDEYPRIIDLARTNSFISIAKIYNVSMSLIGKIVKSAGIDSKRNRLNEGILSVDVNYFNVIDSPKKAYWLGYIAADGCLKNTKGHMSLASKDKEHLEKFKNDIKSEHKISIKKNFLKKTNKYYIIYNIQITNSHFYKKLIKWINIDKSENFVIPNINKNFYPDFLAGMVDGDGSFTMHKDNSHHLSANLISTKECLEQIQIYLKEKLDINITKLGRITDKQPNIWKLYISSNVEKFLKYIYYNEEKSMYLNRKQEKLNEILVYKKYNPPLKGLCRRPVIVYDFNDNILYEFSSTKECTTTLKISTQTFFDRIKTGKSYKSMKFKVLDKIKY